MLHLYVNGEARQFARLMTITELLSELDLAGKRIAVERNGEIVPRGQHSVTSLANDDRLEIVVAVGGG